MWLFYFFPSFAIWITACPLVYGQGTDASISGTVLDEKTKGRLNFTFGTQNTLTNSSVIYTHNTKGRFEFNCLGALEAMRPDRYCRKHTNPGQQLKDPADTDLLELSAYAQAGTRIIPHMEASFGLRYDIAIFNYRLILFICT